jgi:hypothetical protein
VHHARAAPLEELGLLVGTAVGGDTDDEAFERLEVDPGRLSTRDCRGVAAL